MDDVLRIIDQGLKKQGLSDAMASKMAVGNPSLVKNIRNGNRPSFENMQKLLKVLGIETRYVFADEVELTADTLAIVELAAELLQNWTEKDDRIDLDPEAFRAKFREVLLHVIKTSASEEQVDNVVDFQLSRSSK